MKKQRDSFEYGMKQKKVANKQKQEPEKKENVENQS